MIINPISSPSGMKPIIRVTSPIGSSVTCNGETKTVTDTSVDFQVEVVEEPILPSGYTQLDYIESSGTQYIDTGHNPNTGSVHYKLDAQLLVAENMMMCGVFGSSSSCWFRSDYYTSNWFFYYGASQNGNAGVLDTNRHIYEQNANVYKIDGVTVKTFTLDQSIATATFTICKANGYSNLAKLKVFGFMMEDGAFSMHLIPCKNASNEVGMYDLVSEQFFGNAGTGSFIAGNEVPTETRYKSYTVTASKDGKTQSKSVTVDAVALFPVTIDYKLWLYDEGDECEDVTGGWVITQQFSDQTATKGVTSLQGRSVTSSGAQCSFATTNKVNLTGYTTLYMETSQSAGVYSVNCRFDAVGLSATLNSMDAEHPENMDFYLQESGVYSKKVSSKSINPSGEYYVIYGVKQANSDCYKIWLE